MKRYIASLIWLAAVPALAGVAYRFESVSTGITSTSLSGQVRAERGTTRADIEGGDGLTFRSGMFVVGRAGQGAVQVVDPKRKLWYELRLPDFATSILGTIGALGDLRVENETVAFEDRGDGPRLAGYPSRRSLVSTSYDVILGGSRATVRTTTESWTTDGLPADAANAFQMKDARTGIAVIDRLIDLQTSQLRGFPLRQVTIVRVSFENRQWISKTTTRVSDVRVSPIDARVFAVPRDYRQVKGPLGR